MAWTAAVPLGACAEMVNICFCSFWIAVGSLVATAVWGAGISSGCTNVSGWYCWAADKYFCIFSVCFFSSSWSYLSPNNPTFVVVALVLALASRSLAAVSDLLWASTKISWLDAPSSIPKDFLIFANSDVSSWVRLVLEANSFALLDSAWFLAYALTALVSSVVKLYPKSKSCAVLACLTYSPWSFLTNLVLREASSIAAVCFSFSARTLLSLYNPIDSCVKSAPPATVAPIARAGAAAAAPTPSAAAPPIAPATPSVPAARLDALPICRSVSLPFSTPNNPPIVDCCPTSPIVVPVPDKAPKAVFTYLFLPVASVSAEYPLTPPIATPKPPRTPPPSLAAVPKPGILPNACKGFVILLNKPPDFPAAAAVSSAPLPTILAISSDE